MTYVVTDNCIACKYTDCVEVWPGRLFLRGLKIGWLYIPMNVLIAAFVNLSAPQMPFARTPSQIWKNGWISTGSIPRLGR